MLDFSAALLCLCICDEWSLGNICWLGPGFPVESALKARTGPRCDASLTLTVQKHAAIPHAHRTRMR